MISSLDSIEVKVDDVLSQNDNEDCSFIRSLDCDLIFSILFSIVIACLLIFIIVIWLRGVLNYKEYFLFYLNLNLSFFLYNKKIFVFLILMFCLCF